MGSDTVHGAFTYTVKIIVMMVGVPSVYQVVFFFLITLNYARQNGIILPL